MHTAEPLLLEPSCIEVEIPFRKQETNQPPSTNQLPVELMKAAGNTLRSDINELINSV
jgi:hypothetical protein